MEQCDVKFFNRTIFLADILHRRAKQSAHKPAKFISVNAHNMSVHTSPFTWDI